MKLTLILLFAVLAIAFLEAQANEGHNRHSELLKPETNAIDHGPSTHKSGHLLGHRGEHWTAKKKMRKNKKKAHHSMEGVHHDSLDDIRLQDLSYNHQEDAQNNKKKATKKKLDRKVHNKSGYMKKLKLWKAKMMAKKHHKKNQQMKP